jgi:hypothetical protein
MATSTFEAVTNKLVSLSTDDTSSALGACGDRVVLRPIDYFDSTTKMAASKKKPRMPKFCPKERANCLSILFFTWIGPLLRLGWKRPLQDEDIYTVMHSDHSSTLGTKLEMNWFKHLEDCARTRKKPCFRWTVFLTFYKKFLFYGCFSMLEECVFRMIQVVALGFLIDYFSLDKAKLHSHLIAQIACGKLMMHNTSHFTYCLHRLE